MNIKLGTNDMVHICELLREDMHCCEAVLQKMPGHAEAADDLKRSRSILLKIAKLSIQDIDLDDDPIPMETRPELN